MSTTVKRDKERPQQVQVFIRSRPLNKQELESRSCTAVEILNSKELAVRQQYGKHYTFDKIFGPYVKQLDVYASVVEPLIPEVLDGYNCTVFAYGQTGTGKTYTMAGGSVPAVGISWQDDQEAGIIPRALSHLFDELCLIQQQYTVRVSYLELYNEELFDLLSDNVEGKGIRIFEDQHQKGSVIINGIVKETVHNKNEVYEILQKGQEKRRTASTLLNAQSSRSHTVFSIMVHTCETTVEGEELVKTGKLNLVDLAGSENISRSGAVDRRAREAGNINQSLLTLGRVIKALVERSAHIPYRESKLTRILQDSLGGRTKTSIIATISPAVVCLEETLSTLEYASRARNITNRPEVNQRVSQKAWKAQYEKEMERLRKDLHAARTGSGVFLDQENYDRLVNDSEICKEELAEKIANVRELQQQLRNLEIQKEIQEVEWTKMLLSFQETRNKLTEYRNRLKKTIVEKKEQEHLAFCYEAKAETLHDQAQKLLGMTKVTAVNFRKKIDNLCSMSQENTDSMKKISEKVITKCQEVTNELIDFMINFNDCNKNATNLMKAMQEQHIKSYEATELCGNNTIAEVRNLINVTCQDLENSYDVDRQQQEKILGKIEEKDWAKVQNIANISTAATAISWWFKRTSGLTGHDIKFIILQEIKDMTKWVDVKIDLEHIREDLLSNLDSTNKHLTKQQAITEDTANDIRMIDEDINLIHKTVKSVMKRIQLVEQRVSESKDVNCVYMDRINNTQVIVENRILKVSSDLQINIDQAAHLLTEAVNIIQENKEQNLAIVKMLEQLHKCKQNFGNHDQTESKHTVETCLQNLHDITRNHMETAKISKCELSSNSDKIHTQLSQLAEITSQHQEATISGLQECQENLVNLVNGLTDINPGSNTPIRVHFDPSSLAQPSPRDRILMRFHDRYKELSFNESLDFKDEDTLPAISTLPYLPVEDTDIPLHILRSNVQHIQCQDDYLQKKSQKYDKENVPGPSKNTS